MLNFLKITIFLKIKKDFGKIYRIYILGGVFMNMLSQEEINHIRSNVDIVDIISSYIPLTPKGKNYFGTCPFHDDHSPSMSVSKERQIYTCFSCGATGNVFKFVMDYENVSFRESINIIANKAGLNIHLDTHEAPVQHKELYEIYDISAKLYQNNINTQAGAEAKEYLRRREISDEAIKEFGIGLALKKRDILTNLLVKKKYRYEDLLKSGIIVKGDSGYYDIYSNRIMFPIWDTTGKVVGFSGRVYHGETNYKYINTKETEIFKKGELLYNYHRAKEEARRKDVIIIFEGQLDVIRAYSVGIRNVIGTMGTAVTKKHALLIKKLAKNVILCFDGDAAGAKATMACSKELQEVGMTPKIVRLEEGMDPDEYIKKYGKERFVMQLENPMNLMDFKLSYYKTGKDFTDTVDVSHYVKDMLVELQAIPDEITRELTLKKISDETKLDTEFLRRQLEQEKVVAQPKKEAIAPPTRPVVKKLSKYEKAERNLIYYMLKSPEVISMYNKKITFMPTDTYRFLAREISYYYKTYHEINEADFITFLKDDEKMVQAVGSILALNLKEAYSMEEIEDYIEVIREYNVKYETERLKGLMGQATDPIQKAEIATRIVALKMRGEKHD